MIVIVDTSVVLNLCRIAAIAFLAVVPNQPIATAAASPYGGNSEAELASPLARRAGQDYWAAEDPKEREQLPLCQIIPAAQSEELTPANGFPQRETFLTWHRSHGDNGGARYSALHQINRRNVANLQVAWVYHLNPP